MNKYNTNINNKKNKFRIPFISLIIILILVVIAMFIFQATDILNSNSDNLKSVGITYTGKSANHDNKRLLTLVNDDNPLSENFSLNLINYSEEIKLDKEANTALSSMLSDASDSGYNIVLVGGYLDEEAQQQLFDNEVQSFISMGYSNAKANSKANKVCSKGGLSDRQTGLSVVLSEDESEDDFEKTHSYKWISDNCANYGFILRYPQDKEMYTGKSFRSDYYRYVGRENAIKMRSLNMCLEQYNSYLALQSG